MNRGEFIKCAFGAAALGIGPWRLFAAPPGWKPEKNPNLVLGIVSDTHLRTSYAGKGLGRHWPDKYLVSALRHFKAQNVDAVVHCGDLAHRGQVRELEFHAEAWRKVFAGGPEPVKLFISGNHDVEGAGYGDFVEKIYPDAAERAKHVLATDMPAHWLRIWGEKYERVWHREVKGYHFFGWQWGVDEKEVADFIKSNAASLKLAEGDRPFFTLSHSRPHKHICKLAGRLRNAVGFFGHWHESSANWNTIYFWKYPCIQCSSLKPSGILALRGDNYISKAELQGKENAGAARQAFVVRVYDDMLVIERREFTNDEKIGPDWIMPLGWQNSGGKWKSHPFTKEELKKSVGKPQFRKDAKIRVDMATSSGKESGSKESVLKISIPPADANADSRVYAYEMAVKEKPTDNSISVKNFILKAVYASGINLGTSKAANGGVTTLEIPEKELPSGENLVVSVRPLSSLGTLGTPICTIFSRKKSSSVVI